MASPTKKSKVRRKLRHAKSGTDRKNFIRVNGSTAPNLALNKPNANEIAQHKS